MMNNDSTALLDVTQVATMAGLHRATVFNGVQAGFRREVPQAGEARQSDPLEQSRTDCMDRREVSALGKMGKTDLIIRNTDI